MSLWPSPKVIQNPLPLPFPPMSASPSSGGTSISASSSSSSSFVGGVTSTGSQSVMERRKSGICQLHASSDERAATREVGRTDRLVMMGLGIAAMTRASKEEKRTGGV